MTSYEFIALLQETPPSESTNSEYTNKIIYALSSKMETDPKISQLTSSGAFWVRMTVMQMAIWTPIAYLGYTFLHPYTLIIPLLGLSFTLWGTRYAQVMLQSSILRMDLLNEKQISLYMLGSQDVGTVCNIEGANVLSIQKTFGNMGDQKNTEFENKEGISIEASFVQSSNNKGLKVVFMVVPGESVIENVDLFRSVVQGEVGEVEKFSYIGREEEE